MHSEREKTDGRINGASNKKIKKEIKFKNDGREWANLPKELVEFISNKIASIEDYFKFGGVCRNWRQCYLESKQGYMESHSPLVIYIPTAAYDQPSYFYDITARTRCKVRIPYFASNEFIGMSSGYLIIKKVGISFFWVINPFSGHKLQFPLTPLTDPADFGYNAVFASAGSHDNLDFVLVVHSGWKLQFCKLSDKKWNRCSFKGKLLVIRGIVVFDGRIFALTYIIKDRHYQIGVLNLRSCDLEFLKLNGSPPSSNHVWFVASNEHLFIVEEYYSLQNRYTVYRIDFSRMEWVKVKDFGDQCLFIGNIGSSRLCNLTKWGGQSNCVYHLKFLSNLCLVYPLNDETPQTFLLPKCFDSTPIEFWTGWYFPDQSNRIDNIRDD